MIRRNRWKRVLITLVIIGIGVAAIWLTQYGGTELVAARMGRAEETVEYATVTAFTGDIASYVTASGKVQAQREARLSLLAPGEVEEVYVKVGDHVEAGEPLVQLKKDELERAIAMAEQNLVIQEISLQELRNGAAPEDIAAAEEALRSAEATLNVVLAGASAEDIAAAQSSLNSAQTQLQRARSGADPNDVAAAEAQVEAAEAALAELMALPDPNQVTQAQANLESAEAAVKRAQAAYDRVAWDPAISARPESLELEQATINYEAAKAAYDQATQGATSDQIAQAQANIDQARANLNRLLNNVNQPSEIAAAEAQVSQAQANLAALTAGASEEQVAAAEAQVAQARANLSAVTAGTTEERLAIAEAQVEQARLNLETAKANLEAATLVAPFNGIVTAVYVAQGEMASGRAVDLVDEESLEVVLSVDEVDLAEIAVGQPATVRLEGRRGSEIRAEVVSIAPAATSTPNSAIVNFDVHLRLEETEIPALIGMTADATIVTAEHKEVLLVPNRALISNRAAGKYYVNLMTAEGPVQTEVTIGLRDDDNTEIISGIEEGDELLVETYTPAQSSSAREPRPFRDQLIREQQP
ncbi:MAG: efflux RND transporter periplasmic adaptor subunit [Chloroflexota bacterium]|nr:efflux RND transporter periplasmic adaptor subunit [Chloroflexota bacterium]